MSRNLFLLTTALFLSLTLLRVEPVFAVSQNNCTSSQLPWSTVLETDVTENLPIGSVIPGSDSSTVININCSSSWSNDRQDCAGGGGWALSPSGGATPTETSVPGVYSYSGLPSGVGYQLLNDSGQKLPLDAAFRHNTGVAIRTGDQAIPLHFRMIKTSNTLSSGDYTISMYLSCNGNEWANQNADGSLLNVMVSTRVITQTCSLTNPDTLVQLPKVARSAFNGVGSSAGVTPFTLDFRCDASADARFDIGDVSELSNTSDALALQAGSTATGLGVRLLHEGNPVHLASNQIFDQGESDYPLRNLNSSETIISLPFAAEYLQTQDSVTAGTVRAQAMITIDYN
ncbi:fimbrial protein [Pseudomonas sp. EL_65y_Pfl2_R95]|uniref:fimbrial protein n=1 Tax=Pseudomonas sp. EL_65y_Pfl2_R95 TaxID=3088698 RepID=UPI0030D9B2C6